MLFRYYVWNHESKVVTCQNWVPSKFDKNLDQNAESSCNTAIAIFEEQKGHFGILMLVDKA